MRTNTRILWTILVIDFLLLLAESDPTTPALATTKPIIAAAPTAKPTDAQFTTLKSSPVEPTTVKLPDAGPTTATPSHLESTPGKPVTAEPPTTKPINKEPISTTLTAIVPTDAKATTKGPSPTMPAPTGSPIAKLSTKVPITTMPAAMMPVTKKPTPEKPTPENATPANATPENATPEKPTTKNATPEKPTTKNATPEKPTTKNPILEKSATTKPISADSTLASPTGSGPAPRHPATPAPSSVVSTHRQPASDQTPALGPKTPAPTTVASKQPASTQPGPNPTTEEPLASTEKPGLASGVLESEISGPFNETITLEFMQEPRNKKNSIVQSCQMLLEKVGGKGTCSLAGEIKNGRYEFSKVSVAVDSKVMQEIYDAIKKAPAEPTPVPHTLIAILSSCGALVLILVIFALYCTYHHRSYRKNQQHLTEELQTVENGYHDNPTLEVMEVQPEMQEKKVALNGEFNDSWIVPFDNLAKEEIPEEEDTHL